MTCAAQHLLDDLIWSAHRGERPPLLMGIVNITPDSCFDGGRIAPEVALAHARKLIADGADLLDLGAESTRPGAERVDLETEWARLAPVLEQLLEESSLPLSVDTYKPEIARRALQLGAVMINDIRGLRDPEMRKVVAEGEAWSCIMHMQGAPETMQRAPHYECACYEEVSAWLEERRQEAVRDGCRADRITLDPGIGFGKTVEHNLDLLRHLNAFPPVPLLLGLSRKSFMGRIIGKTYPELLPVTIAATTWCCLKKRPAILRVHDVLEHAQLNAILAALEAQDAYVPHN